MYIGIYFIEIYQIQLILSPYSTKRYRYNKTIYTDYENYQT